MEEIVGTIILETEGYRPLFYGVLSLVVLGLIQKAIKRWLQVDISPEGGLLGLVFLVVVISITSLAMNDKDIPSPFQFILTPLLVSIVMLAYAKPR